MTKPIINLDQLAFDNVEDNGRYVSRRATIGTLIGARQLGYNLTVVAPGKVQCPFHNHHGEEEMFFILDGEGELRFGSERYALRRHDVIACPSGGSEVAHQIVNTGTTDLRYLAISNRLALDACEYPDSNKIMVVADHAGGDGLRAMFRADTQVDYYDREPE